MGGLLRERGTEASCGEGLEWDGGKGKLGLLIGTVVHANDVSCCHGSLGVGCEDTWWFATVVESLLAAWGCAWLITKSLFTHLKAFELIKKSPYCLYVAVQWPWITEFTWKGGWKWKGRGAREGWSQDKVLIKAQSLILQLHLIKGKPQNPSFISAGLCCKARLASRKSILLSSYRKLQVQQGDDSTWVVKPIVASTQGLLSLLNGKGHNSPFFIFLKMSSTSSWTKAQDLLVFHNPV